ncbi:acyl-CoA dehydrogenase [Neokomagataea tanensis]|uniref:Dibenzothiophene monooxygenase n=2 Tax=Neokomagataea TaxID=1223423 RepID=A0A4Y6V9A0_9PROT|nr:MULTISPECIES: acyl-CoA dehydrogenase family protein [Neokomagataea]QDH25478.1 acyl-CoA dehydrogenase [Neokomagataea tanensis]
MSTALYEKLDFSRIFESISKTSAVHDSERRHLREHIQTVADAGFTRLRVPRRFGGEGASLVESFGLLRNLAEADPNIPQILRAHFAFVEGLRQRGSEAQPWFDIVNDGKIFGAAMAEKSASTSINTFLSKTPEGLRLNGRKYYSTGTLYADWIIVWAAERNEAGKETRLRILVPAHSEGVTRLDDWDGFGQRLTGSGTTIFDNVHIQPEWVLDRLSQDELPAHPFLATYYQHFHLVTLAGIAQAVLRDAIQFVRPRTRAFGIPGQVIQRNDPIVQNVVGRLASLAFSTRTLVDQISRGLQSAEGFWDGGDLNHPVFERVQEEAFQAQQIVIEQTLEATTLLFDVGGASATSETLGFDRHWRNARVLASHNPSLQRARELGDLALNGTPLWSPYRQALRQNAA